MNSGEFEPDKGSQNKMNPARVPNCHKKAGIKVDPEWSGIEHTENYVSTSKGILRKEPKRRMTKKQRRRERGTDKHQGIKFNKLWEDAKKIAATQLTIVPRKPGGPDSSALLTGEVRDYFSDGERVNTPSVYSRARADLLARKSIIDHYLETGEDVRIIKPSSLGPTTEVLMQRSEALENQSHEVRDKIDELRKKITDPDKAGEES